MHHKLWQGILHTKFPSIFCQLVWEVREPKEGGWKTCSCCARCSMMFRYHQVALGCEMQATVQFIWRIMLFSPWDLFSVHSPAWTRQVTLSQDQRVCPPSLHRCHHPCQADGEPFSATLPYISLSLLLPFFAFPLRRASCLTRAWFISRNLSTRPHIHIIMANWL